MNCSNPQFGFPCGKCLNCRIQYSSMWTTRLLHELETFKHEACFITLTYSDDFIGTNELSKKDAQNFIKRLRKSISPKKIRYFLCGEYGDHTQRKHLHAIIFGLPCNSISKFIIDDAWGFGFSTIGSVTAESCRYVTDYVLKKYSGSKATLEYHDKQPPFRLLSQGLGYEYLISNLDTIEHWQGVFYHGKKKKLPRYYRDKIYEHYLISEGVHSAIRHLGNIRKCTAYESEKAAKATVDWFNRAELPCNIAEYFAKKTQNIKRHKDYMLANRPKGVI